jgi:hypothetical protein
LDAAKISNLVGAGAWRIGFGGFCWYFLRDVRIGGELWVPIEQVSSFLFFEGAFGKCQLGFSLRKSVLCRSAKNAMWYLPKAAG